MAKAEVLPPRAVSAVEAIDRADIVVGIPSFNNARTIGHVVEATHAGLVKYFPQSRAIIVNSDGGSTDGTQEIVTGLQVQSSDVLLISHPIFPVHRLTIPYHGLPGKGSAFRCIFRVAEKLGAKACAVVDSDLRSINPEWVQLLIAPLLQQGYDYVSPYYFRHKYDGTITNSIVYPLTRALYGQRVRQPIGGDFGFSGRLASHFLAQPVWDTDVARYGIDIWMTTTAICGGFRVCQSFLGSKLHDAKDPGADLSAMLVQVLGTVFSLMETHEDVWRRVSGSEETPLMGFRFAVGVEPIAVNTQRMLDHFRNGVSNLRDVWSLVLGPADLWCLEEAARARPEAFRLDDGLWTRIVYDFAAAYHHRRIDRQHLIRSFLPLYMGRVASFVREVAESDAPAVEERLEQLCRVFEENKAHLAKRWSS
ncbi:MAG TPA: glycosyltransferase [Vicinamibacterales bacterium]|nr:glycosyltransferase [Acidobacteriota bacterium]HOC18864.1 glycosyltransferase [Vicinamibacterales bacterium]